ncbi:Cytochrome P450 52A1 [Cladobotryum mycophilum]|uniref:Cytochrome P450 52A1 n=1 Tax=Cladobotryum mycophilum TaxID=491253 RepID=A0ABR0SBS2_9HYPO
MLWKLKNYVPEYPWSLVLLGPCLLLLHWAAEEAVTRYRLRKVNGVRAPLLASSPFGAVRRFWEGAWMQANDRLPEYFMSFFEHVKPSHIHCVEMCFLGRRSLMTEEPEHIKAVLTSNFAKFGKGKVFHDSMSPFLGDSIFTTDGQLWHQSRSLIRAMFVTERIRDLDIFERWSDVLISKFPPPGQTIDICDLFYRTTLDVTMDYLLGQSVNSLENPRGEFTKAFEDVQHSQMILTLLGPFRSLYPQADYKHGIKMVERFIQPFIEATLALAPEELEKLSKSDREFTFLHNIALFTRDPKIIRDQLMAVLLAGRDTTASTLAWTMYELSNYPDIWAKLRTLVLGKVGPTARPTYQDLKEMTYLTHALNEALRLYPAVPFNVRTCLHNSTIPGKLGEPDIAVLEGDYVLYSPLAMQRRKDLYPPVSERFADPAVYSPDRWDHWTPKPWQFVPFNGGPRICIGQNFAMTEMAFIMVRLLQKYGRIEYRGDWAAQFYKTDLVGRPGQGVPVALYEAEK